MKFYQLLDMLKMENPYSGSAQIKKEIITNIYKALFGHDADEFKNNLFCLPSSFTTKSLYLGMLNKMTTNPLFY
jgi:hypothetical protein